MTNVEATPRRPRNQDTGAAHEHAAATTRRKPTAPPPRPSPARPLEPHWLPLIDAATD